jgi:hypothetical protein
MSRKTGSRLEFLEESVLQQQCVSAVLLPITDENATA